MRITIQVDLPNIDTAAAAAETGAAAERACLALEQAIREPGKAQHRVDITNALNYLETVIRQHREIGR